MEADRVARGLLHRPGPDLSQVGRRDSPGWLFRWLESPRKLQAGAVMPRLFPDDDHGRVERYAVASFLATLGGRFHPDRRPPDPRELQASAARGKHLFSSAGCSA